MSWALSVSEDKSEKCSQMQAAACIWEMGGRWVGWLMDVVIES